MTQDILKYLRRIEGGDWSSDEKKQELYNLVFRCAKEFPDSKLISVELGTFAGACLFPMAYAHKELKSGMAIGVDAYDNSTPLEGRNHADVDKYWREMDFAKIRESFSTRKEMEEWSGYVDLKIARTDMAYLDFEDESIALLHQDSAHNTKTILSELELWSPKMKMGGYWVIGSANWGEAVDGYIRLPKFGFKLVKDYEAWEVWQKVGVKKDDTDDVGDRVVAFNRSVGVKKESDEYASMSIAGIDVKPIMLYLSDDENWTTRYYKGRKHFEEIGITNLKCIDGIHAAYFGITGTHHYKLDNPESDEIITDAKVGSFLSMYLLYNVCDSLDNTHFLILEDDTRMQPDFLQVLTQELKNVPPDFDFFFIGSCCAMDKKPVHVEGSVFTFRHNPEKQTSYPFGGNCYIVAKKALPYIISTQRDCYAPADISLPIHSFPNLKVYALLPRIVEQEGFENLAP